MTTYRLIASKNRRIADRYVDFFSQLEEAYRRRLVNGPRTADYWLLIQLDRMKLPDARHGKSIRRDERLVWQYDNLKTALAPLYRRSGALDGNREEIARISAQALGRAITKTDLPEGRL